MNTLKFEPEGWNNEVTKLDERNWKSYKENNETLQGLVKRCDDNYNLYVKIEQNDIRMTNFLKYCLAHKITKEVIDKNYQSMYLEFLFTHKIQLEKYS